ncbi:MAG: N-acetylmuramoyl-L-alanine amidase [Firmicutes bacterium]|nr:N-acetylmuramoyl-L-alanine amidase [Candidatus Fermentithermobacillaceae bacterium]
MVHRRARRRRRPIFVLSISRTAVYGLFLACAVLVFAAGNIPFVPAGTGGPLSGQVVFIDPGHGGIDPGAVGRRVLEKDVDLAVAKHLGRLLVRFGARVVYSRTGDYELELEEGADVEARLKLMKESRPTIVVSIHCNAFVSPAEYGAQTFYSANHPRSRLLAECIQELLKKETNTYREISSRLDHFILNHANVPAVTVELGFLSNPEEEMLLEDPAYQEKLADIICRGILAFVQSRGST